MTSLKIKPKGSLKRGAPLSGVHLHETTRGRVLGQSLQTGVVFHQGFHADVVVVSVVVVILVVAVVVVAVMVVVDRPGVRLVPEGSGEQRSSLVPEGSGEQRNMEKKMVAKSSVVPQPPSRLRDR